ncbi:MULTISPECIES: outer membrane beta-barrel protein [unclassified Citrobacter]|uniref:outer membrane beta-barrel protein n=1 Tax=unclassified Citrobacter TaxID=2644389 RepID=UPI002304B8F3|nr:MULTISPECIES: outer membrane beta-barrel protein [unclassified Citrobacter]MDA8511107.1 outer membrane beta-barrel protein [Citrobacter sp. Igbk 14]
MGLLNFNSGLFIVVLALSASVLAGENVITGGYVHTKTAGKSLSGFNAKYGYTPDESDLGVISSLSISADNENDIDRGYGSALVGASYRINDVLKPYVLAGIARGAIKADGDTDTSTGFAYGAGIQLTPIAGFTIDAGYEGSKIFGSQANSVVLGAGWKF